MHSVVPKILLDWKNTYRVIPSKFPPINFFEDLVDPALMDELFYVESLTNERLRDDAGDISLVSKEDRVCGKGSSVVMAAFTHISKDCPSRFSDGSFGIYYAAKEIETALREKAYHSEKFYAYTNEPAGLITVRVYQSKKISHPLADIRSKTYSHLHHPTEYVASQSFALTLKKAKENGLVFNSVRHEGGQCIAIFRACVIPLPVNQTQHFNYIWNGDKITQAYEVGGELLQF